MTPDELVKRIRAGDSEAAIDDFLVAMPGFTLENLAVNAINWGMWDVAEIILLRMLHEDPEDLGAHRALGNALYSQRRYADSVPHFRKVVDQFPEDLWARSCLCWGYSALEDLEKLRRAFVEAKQLSQDDQIVDWQSGITLRLLKDTHQVHQAHIDDERKRILKERAERTAKAAAGLWTPQQRPGTKSRIYQLRGWTASPHPETASFLVDGEIEIVAAATACETFILWEAEYAPDDNATHGIRFRADGSDHGQVEIPELPAPEVHSETGDACEVGTSGLTVVGKVAATGPSARYRVEYGTDPENLHEATPWEPVPGRLNARFLNNVAWEEGRNWYYAGRLTWDDVGARHVTLHWPFGQDPNHISGIGYMELIYGCWHNSCNNGVTSSNTKWESSDLRDGRFTLRLRTRNLDAKDALYCFGIGDKSTYWMLSGSPIDLSEAGDGWLDLSADFPANPKAWTYAGRYDVQPNSDRYYYRPLNDCLSRNEGNIVFIAPFGGVQDYTTGEIEIAAATVTYRDYNVLHPDNGALLVNGPVTSPIDPANLTNGIYGDMDAGWYQLSSSDGPATFTWSLPAPTKITALVLHQDKALPTARCRITLAGQNIRSFEVEMPDESVHVLPAGEPEDVLSVTLELLSGRGPDGFGLLAVEAFAMGFQPPPSPTPVGVCTDVMELKPGATVHYRVVCETPEETARGEIRTAVVPADTRPRINHLSVLSETQEKTVFQVRLNAMGHQTSLLWRVDDGDWYDIDAGCETTAVDRYVTVRDRAPGAHRFTVRLSGSGGESDEESVSWRR